MLPYYALVGIPLFYGLFKNINPIQQKKKANGEVIAFFLIFFFLLVLRDFIVGTDLVGYIYHFKRTTYLSWNKIFNMEDIEIGYWVLMKIVSFISDDFRALLIVIALICCIPTAYFYYKESDNGVISILLYLTATSIFPMAFSGLRQTVAIVFAIPAFYFVKNKKLILFVLTVFIASLFHKSAWIMLLLYPVYYFKLRTKHLSSVVAPLTALVFLFRNSIFDFLLKFVGEDYQDKYGSATETGAYTMIILIALFVVFSFVAIDEDNIDEETNGLRGILVLTLMLQIFASLNHVAMRFNYYFLLFLPITVTRALSKSNKLDKEIINVVKIVFVVFFTAYFFYDAYTGADTLSIYPYKSMFAN
ncbi:MAG: EpsG family protein [Clostridia bacterium]|nr:EpsG family protein [Clostridia bacterium]